MYQKRHEPSHKKTHLISYANSKDADQPAHSRCLISAFVTRCLVSIMPIDVIPKLRDCASLRNREGQNEFYLAANPEDRLSHEFPHITRKEGPWRSG